MKSDRSRNLVFTLVTLLLLLLPILAAAEWIARIRFRAGIEAESQGFDFHTLFRKSPDPELVHELIPGASIPGVSEEIVINSEGFRDDPFEREKGEGVFRIVLLGDSVAWGYGVDTHEAFPQRLEVLLNEGLADGSPTVEVLNLGVMGYSTAQEARLLETKGVEYAPDLVILAYVLNDPDEVDGGLSRYFDPPRVYLLDAFHRFRRWAAAERIGRTRGGGYPEVIHTLYWDEVVRNLDRFQKVLEEQGMPMAVAQIPAFSWEGDRYPEEKLEVRLSEEFERHGFRSHRLNPVFRGTNAKDLSFDFWHPTAEGHRIIAEDLSRFLRGAGLVPLPPLPPRAD